MLTVSLYVGEIAPWCYVGGGGGGGGVLVKTNRRTWAESNLDFNSRDYW